MDAEEVGLAADAEAVAPVADTAPLPPRALLPLPGSMMLLAMPPPQSGAVPAPTCREARSLQSARLSETAMRGWPRSGTAGAQESEAPAT